MQCSTDRTLSVVHLLDVHGLQESGRRSSVARTLPAAQAAVRRTGARPTHLLSLTSTQEALLPSVEEDMQVQETLGM